MHTVHLCLDRGLFWPLTPAADDAPRPVGSSPPRRPAPADAARDGTNPSESDSTDAGQQRYVEPAARRRASALDKVLHRFGGKSATEKVDETSAIKSRLDQEREWMRGSCFGEASVVQSKQPCSAVVLVLHGLGSTGADWEQLGLALRLPWVKFVFPTASRQPVAIAKDVLPSWFDTSQGSLMTQVALDRCEAAA